MGSGTGGDVPPKDSSSASKFETVVDVEEVPGAGVVEEESNWPEAAFAESVEVPADSVDKFRHEALFSILTFFEYNSE